MSDMRTEFEEDEIVCIPESYEDVEKQLRKYQHDNDARVSDVEESVEDEAEARAQADTALGEGISAEAEARYNADQALAGSIDEEAEARSEADTALGGRIDAEATARDAAIAEAVAVEKTRAEDAEGSIADDVEAISDILGTTTSEDVNFLIRQPQNARGIARINRILGHSEVVEGEIVSFEGAGIKTTGKNWLTNVADTVPRTENGITFARNADGSFHITGTATATALFYIASNSRPSGYADIIRNLNGIKLICYGGNQTCRLQFWNGVSTWMTYGGSETSVIPPSALDTSFWAIGFAVNSGYTVDETIYPVIVSASAQICTLPLPVSAYFEGGMKVCANITWSSGDPVVGADFKDEMTADKAIKRVGFISDLGVLDWSKGSGQTRFSAVISDMRVLDSIWNGCFTLSNGITFNKQISSTTPSADGCGAYNNNRFLIRIAECDEMTASEFKTYITGVSMAYACTPAETSINPPLLLTYRADEGCTEVVDGAEVSMLGNVSYLDIPDTIPDVISGMDAIYRRVLTLQASQQNQDEILMLLLGMDETI